MTSFPVLADPPFNVTKKRACGTKRQYGSRQAARRALQGIRSADDPIEVYRCPFCPYYHLGHKPRRRA